MAGARGGYRLPVFNWAIFCWVVSGALIATVTLFIEDDEKAARSRRNVVTRAGDGVAVADHVDAGSPAAVPHSPSVTTSPQPLMLHTKPSGAVDVV